MTEWIDTDALARGLWVTIGAALPITLTTAAADLGDGSPWAALSLVAVLAVFFAGGFASGRRVPPRSLSHGALVGIISFAAIQLVLVPISLFTDDGFDVATVPGLLFVAFLLSNVAMVGGLLGGRANRSQHP